MVHQPSPIFWLTLDQHLHQYSVITWSTSQMTFWLRVDYFSQTHRQVLINTHELVNTLPAIDILLTECPSRCVSSVNLVLTEFRLRCQWCQLRVDQDYHSTLNTWSNYLTIIVQEVILSCCLLWREDSYSWFWTIHKFTQFMLFKKTHVSVSMIGTWLALDWHSDLYLVNTQSTLTSWSTVSW